MQKTVNGTLAVIVALFAFGQVSFAEIGTDAKITGDPAKGKVIFGQFCAACHGPSGKGDGAAAAALNPKPRNLTDTEYMSKLTDSHILKVIAEGGASVGLSPMMAPWAAALPGDGLQNVAAYVRSLSKPKKSE